MKTLKFILAYKCFGIFSLIDSEGDHVLVENDTDIQAIIQMNKGKCMAGESIRLCVMDVSKTSSPTVISPTDSAVKKIEMMASWHFTNLTLL